MELLVCNGYTKGNYGLWLNTIMTSAPSEWVMFHDHDIFLADKNWYDTIIDNIEKADNPGLLTCVTNRIGNWEQRVKSINTNDVGAHTRIANMVRGKHNGKPLRDVTERKTISGLVMVTNKKAWKEAGGFRVQGGIIGLDNDYHRRIRDAGYKVYIMDNLYVYHWYRQER